MKKISTKISFSIIPISNNIFVIIRLNDFIIYDTNTKTIISKSPKIKNISTIMFDEKKNILFAVNTLGRVIVLGDEAVKTRIKIRADAMNKHWFFKDHFFCCVDTKGNLTILSENGKKSSTLFFDERVDAVYKHGDKVYVALLKRNSNVDPLDVTSKIYECNFFNEQINNLKLVYKDAGFIEEIKRDINYISTSILLDKDNGIGRKKELVIFPQTDFQTRIILDLLDIEHRLKKNGIFYNYATNVDCSLVALLFFDEVIVWDYEKQEIKYREKIEGGRDIVWVSDNKLLVASLSGLAEMKLRLL